MIPPVFGALAAIFVVVNGQGTLNSCLDASNSDYICAVGGTSVSFEGCDLNDDDIADIATCLDTIGRSSIESLSFDGNSLTSAIFSTPDSNGDPLLDGLDQLTELNLSSNEITSPPAGAFSGLGSLTILTLDANPLGSLEADVFAGLGSLEELSLDVAQITSIADGAFDGLGSIIELDLDGNNIGSISGGMFAGLGTLQELKIDEAGIDSIGVGAFADLESLIYLDLDDNPLVPGSIEIGAFDGLGMLQVLKLRNGELGDIEVGLFDGLTALIELDLDNGGITSVADGAFADLESLIELDLDANDITAITSETFDGLETLQILEIKENALGDIEAGTFDGLTALTELDLRDAGVTSLPAEAFADLESLTELVLEGNQLGAIPSGLFDGLTTLEILDLEDAAITSIPAGSFDDLEALDTLSLQGNPDLVCVPGFQPGTIAGLTVTADDTFDLTGQCGCDPNDDTTCEDDLLCCPQELLCKDPETFAADACGDPHMTGFHGQKFDFTGEDGAWYCLLSDSAAIHLNMRVTAPVPGRADITYITGVSILTTDSDGVEHSVVITVQDPHSLQSSCPTSKDGSAPLCIADGALSVVLDGQEGTLLLEPGTAFLGPGVTVDAVNLPGACRSFGFEHYWERKKLEYAQAGRRLAESQSLGEWILGDPTATNMDECIEYVARVVADGTTEGLFNHQSEHASFRIVTPRATIRLSHGRLHQTATGDAIDAVELPDHLTWQMNVAIDQKDVTPEAKGVLGETIVPRRGPTGKLIMEGMEALRGQESEYRVAGPLEQAFGQDMSHHL